MTSKTYTEKEYVKALSIVPSRKPYKKKKKKPVLKKRKVITPPKENWFISKGASTTKASPMEKMVAKKLRELGIKYHREVSFKDLNPTGSKWGFLRFDFYIPSAKAVIEYDGKGWHETKDQLRRDELKNQYCANNGIKMIRLIAKDIPTMSEILKINLM